MTLQWTDQDGDSGSLMDDPGYLGGTDAIAVLFVRTSNSSDGACVYVTPEDAHSIIAYLQDRLDA